MRKVLFLIALLPVLARAEQTKTKFNPFTGKLDYITKLDSSTLPSGSTQYIQNTATPSTNTQVFKVSSGTVTGDLEFSDYTKGVIFHDSAACRWRTTIATTGALVTTLIDCPAVVVSRPCTSGMPLGLLLSITCP